MKSRLPLSQLGKRRKRNSKLPYKGAAHTPASQKGIGDFYGTSIRAKLGKMRDGVGMNFLTAKDLKKPPKSTT